MVAPTTRALPLGQSLDDTVRTEIETLRANGELDTGYKTQPRCHVCCETESKDLVNKLLAAGLTNREIAEACGPINGRREEKGDERMIGLRNVWTHRKEHFNLDKPVQAAYRSIMERRAREANIDIENGEVTAVTPYAVLETTMVKGFGTITAEDTVVTVSEAVNAAAKFAEMLSKDQGQRKMADLLFTMDRIVRAAQNYIPTEHHAAFLSAVRGGVDQPIPQLAEQIHQEVHESMREFTPSQKPEEGEDI